MLLDVSVFNIQDKWEYRNQAVSLSQKLRNMDDHILTLKEYIFTARLQKIFHLYYLTSKTLSEGMKVAVVPRQTEGRGQFDGIMFEVGDVQ